MLSVRTDACAIARLTLRVFAPDPCVALYSSFRMQTPGRHDFKLVKILCCEILIAL